MAKKKAKKKSGAWMKFYDLRLNDEDIEHLRFVLECECDMQQDLMKSPSTKPQTAEEKLQDWVIARDMYAQSLKVLQMIDKVHPKRRK